MSYDQFESTLDELANQGYPLTDTDGEYLAPDENYTLNDGDQYWTRTTEAQSETTFGYTNTQGTGGQGTGGQGTGGQGTGGQGTGGQGTGGQGNNGTGGMPNADWQQTLNGMEDAGLPTVDSTGNPLRNDGTVYDLNGDNQWVEMGPTGGQGSASFDFVGNPVPSLNGGRGVIVGDGIRTEATGLGGVESVDSSGNPDASGAYEKNSLGQYSAAPSSATSEGLSTFAAGTPNGAMQPTTLRLDGKDTVNLGGFQQAVTPDDKIVAWFLNDPQWHEEVIVTGVKPEGIEFKFPGAVGGDRLWTTASLAAYIDDIMEGQIPPEAIWDDNAPAQEDDEEKDPLLEEVVVTADRLPTEDPSNIPFIPNIDLSFNPNLNPNGQPMDNIVITAPAIDPLITPDVPTPVTPVPTPITDILVDGINGTDGTDGTDGGRGGAGPAGPVGAAGGMLSSERDRVPFMKRPRIRYPSRAEQLSMFNRVRSRQRR